MLRRAKGLEANKFLFSVIVSNTSNVPSGFTSLTVEWKRGRKIVFTQAALVTAGVATFDQELKMVCTLYQDPKDKSYQEKTTRFVVRQRLGKSKKKVGEVEIDLANYASKEGSLDAPTLSLPLSKGAGGPNLSVVVRSHWVGDGDSDESDCSDMSRTSVDTSMSGASMISSASDARLAKTQMDGLGRPTRGGSNITSSRSPAVQKAAAMASGEIRPSPLGPRQAAAAESSASPVRALPSGGGSNALSAAVSSVSAGAGDSRELSVLRNENRRLAAELKAAQLSLSAARKERDLSRDDSRKLKEQLRNSGPAAVSRVAASDGGAVGGSDSFGAINRADGSQERADRAVLDSLSTEDLRSILAAREAELGAVKIRWADSETEKELAEHKVRRVKKMLHKVGVERDQLACKVTDLQVKLAEAK